MRNQQDSTNQRNSISQQFSRFNSVDLANQKLKTTLRQVNHQVDNDEFDFLRRRKFDFKRADHNNVLGNCARGDIFLKNFEINRGNCFKISEGRGRDGGTFTFTKTIAQIDSFNSLSRRRAGQSLHGSRPMLWVSVRNGFYLIEEKGLRKVAEEFFASNRSVVDCEFLECRVEEVSEGDDVEKVPDRLRAVAALGITDPKEEFYNERNQSKFQNEGYYPGLPPRYRNNRIISEIGTPLQELLRHQEGNGRRGIELGRKRQRREERMRPAQRFANLGKDLLKATPSNFGGKHNLYGQQNNTQHSIQLRGNPSSNDIEKSRQQGRIRPQDTQNIGLNNQPKKANRLLHQRALITFRKSEHLVFEVELIYEISDQTEHRLTSEKFINVRSQIQIPGRVSFMRELPGQKDLVVIGDSGGGVSVFGKDLKPVQRSLKFPVRFSKLFNLPDIGGKEMVMLTHSFGEVCVCRMA